MNVDFVTAIKLFFANYANFRGRSTRAEYWWATLFIFIATLILDFIPYMSYIFSLAVLIPTLAIMTRRFHDIGRSGWWIVGFYAVSLISMTVCWGSLIPDLMKIASGAANPMTFVDAIKANQTSILSSTLIAAIIGIWSLIWLVKPSAPDNQYGPNPYGQR